jgi:hypothetical protein
MRWLAVSLGCFCLLHQRRTRATHRGPGYGRRHCPIALGSSMNSHPSILQIFSAISGEYVLWHPGRSVCS